MTKKPMKSKAKKLSRKYEELSREIVKKKDIRDAYCKVYKKDRDSPTAKSYAYVLGNKDVIQDRVAEILKKNEKASLDNIIKHTLEGLEGEKEVVYNSKGESKFISDPTQRQKAQEMLYKLHKVQGFTKVENIQQDNRQVNITFGSEDVEQASRLLRELKELNTIDVKSDKFRISKLEGEDNAS